MILALRGELGGWGVRGWLGQALVLLLFRRLGEICGRMERLAERFAAGRVVRRVARVAPAGVDKVEAAAGGARPKRVWPGRFAWLVRAAGYQAVAYGSQLRAVLETPEMVALLTEVPQARRLLRPLCRMLAVEASVLTPWVPVVERPALVRIKRPRKPRVPIDWGRIPLPRGVLSAARRAGFKPVR